MRRWRLLVASPLPGRLNMALDEALLRLHERGLCPPTLRLYRWQPPALSLGRFQPRPHLEPEVLRHLGLEVVRRPTGGRAVLHLHEITYAVVAGSAEGLPSSPGAAYHLLCQGLLAALGLLGVEAELGREAAKPPEPEVCFLRQTRADIICRGRKFVGSAQTWRGSSLLQHGSIVLAPQAAELAALFRADPDELGGRVTSLSEILGRPACAAEVARAVVAGFAEALGACFQAGGLSPQEWSMAWSLAWSPAWPAEQEQAWSCSRTTPASPSAACPSA